MSRRTTLKGLRLIVLAASALTLAACGGGGGSSNNSTSETTYVVAVSSSPAQCGSVSGGGTYAASAPVTVTATANTSCSFLRWSESGSEVSATASYAFSITSDRTLVAEFATIDVTSHTDGQTITGGNRAVTLAWSVNEAQSVTLSHNGAPVTVTASAGSYSADLTLANGVNTLAIAAQTTAGDSATKSLTLNYPVLAFTNGQAASVAIGQPDLTSNSANQGGGSAAANTLNYPYGNPVFLDGVLYVSDSGNNRVLGFNTIPTASNAAASFALGQDLLTTRASGNGASQLNWPMGAAVADGRLLITDNSNSRVLVWNTAPKGNVAADLVIGQTGFGLGTSACARNRLNMPADTFAVAGKLIIADMWNNRVLIWNTFPTSSGQDADLVLGQADFTSCSINRAQSAAANTLYNPDGVWSDGTRLFVADMNNNRILVWNTFPTTNGQPADWVLGQPDMNATSWGSSASTFCNPWQLHFSGNQFFVADASNNRVLIWDSLPTSNTPADRVLGQTDFQSKLYGIVPTATSQAYTAGVYAHDNKLLVIDGDNHRVIVYEAP